MASASLDVSRPIEEDLSITYAELHTYQPYNASALGHSDEIRILIQNQDVYTLPWDSHLYLEGKLTLYEDDAAKTSPGTNALLAPNGLAFLFEEVRYELNGVVVDRVKNPGMTSTLKAYASLQPQEAAGLQMAGFCQPESQHDATFLTSDGSFSACIPLRHLLGFAEDHNRIVINMR